MGPLARLWCSPLTPVSLLRAVFFFQAHMLTHGCWDEVHAEMWLGPIPVPDEVSSCVLPCIYVVYTPQSVVVFVVTPPNMREKARCSCSRSQRREYRRRSHACTAPSRESRLANWPERQTRAQARPASACLHSTMRYCPKLGRWWGCISAVDLDLVL
jgi:hypothetical protein